jgi:group I intron endonuclease
MAYSVWYKFNIHSNNIPIHLPGCYRIVNLINGKSYIGLARDVFNRGVSHNNGNSPPKLRNGFNKYGRNNFLFEPIYYIIDDTLNSLSYAEASLIEEFNSVDNGYNIQLASGSVGPYGPEFAAIARETWTRPSVREKRLVSLQSAERRQQKREAWLGRKMPAETVAKVVAGNTGKKRSAEFCEQNRQRRLGMTASLSTRIKLSNQRRGVPKSEAHRNSIRKATLAYIAATPNALAKFTVKGLKWWHSVDGSVRYMAKDKRNEDDLPGMK